MTSARDDLIERLAREACMTEPDLDTREWDHELWKASTDDLHRFAFLVARECARMADSSGMQMAIMEKFKEPR